MISDAIMRGMDLDSRDREDSLDDALKDLDSLMRKAKDMVRCQRIYHLPDPAADQRSALRQIAQPPCNRSLSHKQSTLDSLPRLLQQPEARPPPKSDKPFPLPRLRYNRSDSSLPPSPPTWSPIRSGTTKSWPRNWQRC
jgi:hypothetical protein